MLDLLPHLGTWRPAASGQRCAVATVVGTAGSVPRPLGTSMLVSEAGEVLGSLSGGCVEGAVVEAALEALRDGGTRREFFGYSADDAFAAGLTCGGGLEIHIEPLGTGPGRLRLETLYALAGRPPAGGAALIRRVDAGGGGAVVVPDPAAFQVLQSAGLAALLGAGSTGAGPVMLAAAAQLEPLLRGGRTGLVRIAPAGECLPEPVSLLVESRLPAARLLIFGANDFGAALVPAAKLLGFHVTVCDARPAFAQQDRFSAADEVATAWPHRYLADQARAGRTDARTAICVLTHDPKFDVPLLQAALRLDVAYVGAMGSRRSHRGRIDALRQAGVADEDLARLHSPIGLDLGAVTPGEVAVSIAAELVASRSKAAGLAQGSVSLKDASGPIHHYAATHQNSSLHASDHHDSNLHASDHHDNSAGMPEPQEAQWT
ncbi:XdhC/CoxI family protein [Arthrobacter sp. ES3-54]|uniref:XdhC family protein n=1 Tax=Arthrobacter sp. ES3-54 TaxID=1502991 RepID=UPI00240755EB|nr:XdhC/CoxI family protein [Arthrobacter sp. ES3-54]MDF9752527.1 xanthine dehydrogenase accessory factor [Arthrobacter sp. ES3-54]